jgi:hypothetical protein
MKKPLIKICLLEFPVLIESEVMPVPGLMQEPVTMAKSGIGGVFRKLTLHGFRGSAFKG